jgi:putative ABC transport system permease protein
MSFGSAVPQAVRTLAKRPGFTVVAVITLALGIGPTTAIISVGSALLLRPLPYPDADRVVVVWQADRTEADESAGYISHLNQEDVRREARSLEASAQWRPVNATLTGLGPAEMTEVARVTPEFLRVFNSVPVLGRDFTDADDVHGGPKVVIISDAFWRERLGARGNVLGSTLTIGGDSHEIIGVAPSGFAYPQSVRMWLPLQNDDESCGRGCMNSVGIARRAAGASARQVSTELHALGERLEAAHPRTNTNITLRAAPLRDVVVGNARTPILLLLGAVGMVLLIACANVANLVLVHGDARRTEIAVRTALGADRREILRQLMTENVLLALLGGAAGLLLGAWCIAGLRALAPAGIPMIAEIGLGLDVLLLAAAIVLGTTLIFGLAPALRIADMNFAHALRQGRGSSGERGSQRFRTTVLATEVALSVMLLLGAALMVRSMVRMRSVDLGIDSSNVAQFRLTLPSARYATPEAALAFLRQLDERLERIPNVERASAIISIPFTGLNIFSGFTRMDRPVPEPDAVPAINYRAFDEDALAVLGIGLLRGRAFTEADRRGTQPVALINEAAARAYWPDEDPIGRQIDLQVSVGYPESEPRTIIGITADFRRAVAETPQPEIYVPYAQAGAAFPQIALRYRGAEAGAVLLAAQREVQALDPSLAVARPGSIASLVQQDLAAPTFYLMVLGLFALLAVVLAAVGLYGVVAYLVVRRTHEIGIRIALGGRVSHILQLIVWQGLRPALFGAVAGLAGALATGRILRSILFETAPTDTFAMIATVLMLLIVVLAATAIPALRAARIPPVEALRTTV